MGSVIVDASRSEAAKAEEPEYPSTTPHLNAFGLQVRSTPSAGRGVFATRDVPAREVIEISPVLVFPADEYELHGQHTLLDSYTFVWRKRERSRNDMALALGLGSLFNHHPTSPNVSYTLDREHKSIRYITVRSVAAGEELCISYGAGRMWWEGEGNANSQKAFGNGRRRASDASLPPTEETEWQRMANLGLDEQEEDVPVGASSPLPQTGVRDRQKEETVPRPVIEINEGCPLWRVTAAQDPMRIPLKLADAWVIDVPAQLSGKAIAFTRTHAAKLGKESAEAGWLALRHLRAVRAADAPESKALSDEAGGEASRTASADNGSLLTVLLCLKNPGAEEKYVLDLLRRSAPFFSEDNGRLPRVVKVPTTSAPCRQRLPEWNAYWPVNVRGNVTSTDEAATGSSLKMIDRAADRRSWTLARLDWVRTAFRRCVRLAAVAKQKGELPIGVHVTEDFGASAPAYFTPYLFSSDGAAASEDEQKESWRIEVDAHDVRCSERNPLKHGVVNAIRSVADLRVAREKARENGRFSSKGAKTTSQHSGTGSSDRTLAEDDPTPRLVNGQDYLLTSLTLFSTHEPCVYCTMALVHSRVRAVYFLVPAPKAGGCCGAALGDRGACEGMLDGGPYALQEQSGLNHRFDVWRWVGPWSEVGVEDAGMLELNGLDP